MKEIILKPADHRLREPCSLVSSKELRSKEFQQTIDDILDFVYGRANKGPKRLNTKPSTAGLSANQLGLGSRVSVLDLGIGHKSYSDLYVLVNPKIIWESKSVQFRAEGCVNLPNIWGYVSRSQRVKVMAQDRSGNGINLDLHGWPAVLIQHEIDHLNGVLFIDRLENAKKAHLVKPNQYLAYKKLKQNWGTFVDVSKMIRTLS